MVINPGSPGRAGTAAFNATCSGERQINVERARVAVDFAGDDAQSPTLASERFRNEVLESLDQEGGPRNWSVLIGGLRAHCYRTLASAVSVRPALLAHRMATARQATELRRWTDLIIHGAFQARLPELCRLTAASRTYALRVEPKKPSLRRKPCGQPA